MRCQTSRDVANIKQVIFNKQDKSRKKLDKSRILLSRDYFPQLGRRSSGFFPEKPDEII
jgi:hypothetical protein